MTLVELLSPAGDLEKLKTAIRFGADAVYLGGSAFNLRARSSNFSKSELQEAVRFVHEQGKKAYVALNILAHDREIRALPQFVKFLDEIKVDAVIVSDLGVIDLVKEFSNLEIHVSTQSSVTNWRAAKTMKSLGASRVVLAREASFRDIKSIRENVPDLEIEVFVHGSMCMAYSGRCQLSHYMADQDSNRGACTNTCRWKYHLVEERRPGEFYPVYEDDSGSYIYNSKDLCAIEFLDKILDLGVTSLKIEGRMKSLMYTAMTTRAYRKAISSYQSGAFKVDPEWLEDLTSYSHRGYTTGFFEKALLDDHNNREGNYLGTHEFIAVTNEVTDDGDIVLDVRGQVKEGEFVDIVTPEKIYLDVQMPKMVSIKTGEPAPIGHPGQCVRARFEIPIRPLDFIRKKIKSIC